MLPTNFTLLKNANAVGTIELRNDHVCRELTLSDGVWRTTRISRADGSDAIATVSDEFHILPLDGNQGLMADWRFAEGFPFNEDGQSRPIHLEFAR